MIDAGAELLAQLDDAGDARAVADFSATDKAVIRKYLDSDLYAFAIYIFGHRDLIPTLHGDLAAWIKNWGMVEVERGGMREWLYFTQVRSDDKVVRDYRRIMTQIPREHFKTSMGTLANSLWQASRLDPDGVPGVYRPVAVVNESQDNAVKWLRGIRNIIQSSLIYQTIYEDLIPPGIAKGDTRSMPRFWRWNDAKIDLNGKRPGEVEASLSAYGIESATTGGHWPKIILDDLISIKHKQSELEMERAREWVKNHIYLMRPAENSLAYTNCTAWTYTDIYTDLCRSYGYKLYRRSALENSRGEPDVANGESIFPQKLSTAKLKEMYARNPWSFLAQMQNTPTPGEHQSFSPEWLKFGSIVNDMNGEPAFLINSQHYNPESVAEPTGEAPPRLVPLHTMDKALILDPAPTEPTEQRQAPHARNAILVEGIDCWGRRYILESWAERSGYENVIKMCFELAAKWGISRLHVEEVNFSNVYRHWIAREQRPDGKYPNQYLAVLPLKPNKRDKHTRILAREPAWRQGLYYLNTEGTLPFQVEYTEYPNSSTVDLLDCMGYDTDVLTRPESYDERVARRRLERDGGPYSQPYYTQPLEGY